MTKPQTANQPYSVSEITNKIREYLEINYDWIQVQGEISNFKKAPSGHAYFSLKDENAILNCVAWRSTVVRWAGLDIQDGMDVIAGGKMSLYPPRGQYQLIVSSLRLAGEGALQLRFEALKRKLAAEGLFDAEHKKPLPTLPQKIALITSPTGAAVRDFLNTIKKARCPVYITVCPVLVQGMEAPHAIADMIRRVNERQQHDMIILCRGGGSLEDLWAFNEEVVARAIYHSHLPVVTGIGHEIDFSIADFVADHRASTPTGAAQVLTNFFESHRHDLKIRKDRLLRTLKPNLQRIRNKIEVTRQALRRYHPSSSINMLKQRLDDYQVALINKMKTTINEHKRVCTDRKKSLDTLSYHLIQAKKKDIERCKHLLQSYDPQRTLERGFAICRRPDGKALSRIESIEQDDMIDVSLFDGSFQSKVMEVIPQK